MYMSEKRQGQINSYGDNTNLLTMVSIESAEDEETWVLRSAAFIAGSSQVMWFFVILIYSFEYFVFPLFFTKKFLIFIHCLTKI